jgi:hypothetical protein
MRTYFNKHRKEIDFKVGQYVLLDTRNIKLASTKTKKLQARYVGPFQITKRVGRVAYKLHMPRQSVHPVFHVSLLK